MLNLLIQNRSKADLSRIRIDELLFTMKFRYVLIVVGFLTFILFVISKNGILQNNNISNLLSSDYIFYFSLALIFLGYFLSGTSDKKRKDSTMGDSTPGLGGKKSFDAHSSHDNGGGGGD